MPAVLIDRHRQCARLRIGLEHAEELRVRTGRAIRLQVGRRAVESHFRSERLVDHARRERARVRGAGDELPERIEILRYARARD